VSALREPPLRDLLEERSSRVTPRADALERVHRTARRRRRRRRVAGGATALVATTVALSFAGGVLREPVTGPPAGVAAIRPTHTLDAAAYRASLGITGQTKGASSIVVAKSPAPEGQARLATWSADTGVMQRSLSKNVASASVSPQETSVAMVTKDDRVVVESAAGGAPQSLGHQRPGSTISWDPSGTALFALVDGQWQLVPAPSATGEVTTTHRVPVRGVPRLPGGPSFLSVSPDKDYVVLFGVSAAVDGGTLTAGTGRPHLYLGHYDGHRVSGLRPLRVPVSARQGPMGWLGDNAFVIGTGAGSAWIVRVTSSHLAVEPALPQGCSLDGAPAACTSRGPRLLGTNASGSLLYWRVSGHPEPGNAGTNEEPRLIAYFSTWLDGSHVRRLTGPAGTYGPALAAR
jgi:hypothetical protein